MNSRQGEAAPAADLLGGCIDDVDWSQHPLGPVEAWPEALRHAACLCRHAFVPMVILWGDDAHMLHNAAYSELLDPDMRAAAQGRRASEVLGAAWQVLSPMVARTRASGTATAANDLPLKLYREGALEQTYFSFSLNPILVEHGRVGGVLAVVHDTTQSVQLGRAEVIRRRLEQVVLAPTSSTAAIENALDVLGEASEDFQRVSCFEKRIDQWVCVTAAADMAGVDPDLLEQACDEDRRFAGPTAVAVGSVRRLIEPIRLPSTAAPPRVLVFDLHRERRDDASLRLLVADSARILASSLSALEQREATLRVIEAEQALSRQLTDIFNHAPVGIAVTRGPAHVFEYVNETYCRLFQARDFIGKTLRQNFSEYSDEIMEAYDAAFRSGEARAFTSLRADTYAPDGTLQERYFEVVFQPLRDASNHVDRIAIIGYDVTGLTMARRDAENANREKDRFLAMLGHELRNPLAPIRMAVELMQRKGAEPFARELAIIERQVRHLVRLVDDLLDVARVARGAIELKRSPIEIADAVAKAVEISAPLIESKAHTLLHAVPAGPLTVLGDGDRLVQILCNLLNNAAKYTPAGGRVTISVREEEGIAVVEVSDTGLGLNPGDLERIFDIFVQGQQGIDRADGGLGLGLTIARSLAAVHGGRLYAKSPGIGLGSTFTLELPLLEAAYAAKEPEEKTDLRTPVGGGRPILVVDDHPDVRESVAAVLESWGFVPLLAGDGREALMILDQNRVAAGLLDIGLPGMDGFALAKEIRRRMHTRNMLLVAMTGYGQQSDLERAREAGFDEHLVKPVSIATLAAHLRDLGKHSA